MRCPTPPGGPISPSNPRAAGFLALATAALLTGSCQTAIGPSPTPTQPDALTIRPVIEGLKLGQDQALTAVVVSGSAAPRTVPASWSSDSPDVAAITEDGRLRGLHLGKATIAATFQVLSALQPVRVVSDYGGTWEGRYRVVNCTRFSGPGSDYCRFVVGGDYPVRTILVQDGARLAGTLEFYSSGGRLIESGLVEGTIDSSGALVLTGIVSSVVSEQPGETRLSDWTTTMTEDGNRMLGRFAKNPHFRNAFGWQDSREDCEIASVTRTQR